MQLALKKANQTHPISGLSSHPVLTSWSLSSPTFLSPSAQLFCWTMECYHQLHDHGHRWKKQTQNKPNYCPNSKDLWVHRWPWVSLPSTCTVYIHSKHLQNNSQQLLREHQCHWLNPVQRHTCLGFLGISPPSKKKHLTWTLQHVLWTMARAVHKAYFNLKSTPFPALLHLSILGATRFKGRLVAVTPVQGKCLPKAELRTSVGIYLARFSPHTCRGFVSSTTFFPLMSPNLLQLLLNFSVLFEHPDMSSLTIW